MTVIEKINAEYPQMTKSEKQLSGYLLAHLREFEKASINDLAGKNGVSTTTLIRFARKLGYDGFKEFKRALCADSVVFPTLVNKYESMSGLSGNDLLANTITHGWACIEQTFSRLSDETIDKTVALLSSARRVYTFGMKESYALAHYAYTRFYTVREDAFLLDVSGGDLEPILDMQPQDVCMAFLFHRYTQRALDLLSQLKRQGISVILVTNEPCEEVKVLADVCICCTVDGLGIKNTSLAPICLLDFLCNVLAANGSQRALERFKSIEDILKAQGELGD